MMEGKQLVLVVLLLHIETFFFSFSKYTSCAINLFTNHWLWKAKIKIVVFFSIVLVVEVWYGAL